MTTKVKIASTSLILLAFSLVFSSFLTSYQKEKPFASFPYKNAGLSERQAAAHLLSRFTFGATLGEVDAVVKTGLEKWFNQQLNAEMTDDSLNRVLNKYDALQLSNEQLTTTYTKTGKLVRMAIKDGTINKDSVSNDDKRLTENK